MSQDKLPQLCGMAVCAVIVLGIDDPRWGMPLGVLVGAIAIYMLSFAARLDAARAAKKR